MYITYITIITIHTAVTYIHNHTYNVHNKAEIKANVFIYYLVLYLFDLQSEPC